MRNCKLYLGLLCCLLFGACSGKDNLDTPSYSKEVFKVAVIVPGELLPYWQRSAEWAQDILHRAQVGLEKRVEIELVFRDEYAPDIEVYMQTVAEDESYAAIIGPVGPELADLTAKACRTLKKTLILPITANAEFQRIYSTLDHVFNLTQSDIMQVDAMLAIQKGEVYQGISDDIGLVTTSDMYGQSFYDWFGFLAEERGFNLSYIKRLGNKMTIDEVIKDHYDLFIQGTRIDRLFFASSDGRDLIDIKTKFDEMEALHKDSGYSSPTLICGDACVHEKVAESLLLDGVEGVEPTANPSSGFVAAYQAKFGEHPRRGEAQVFDAVYLLYYSLMAMLTEDRELVEDTMDSYGKQSRTSPLWEYFIKVVDTEKTYSYNWFDFETRHVFNGILEGDYLPVSGASSNLDFDKKHHCSVTSTVYRHWKLHEGKFITMQYLSADGGDRTISTINDWSYKVTKEQGLEHYTSDIVYPEHKGNYAVIVAASKGWSNYRHQADALAMYQALLERGFDHDHIILIIEDDIASHEKNIYPGKIMVEPGGENLYEGAVIDYRMSSLYPADIYNILTGVQTARTPIVLEAGENDNVFLFWSGHGKPNSMIYNGVEYTSPEVRKTLETMRQKKKYRKLFFVMETCFSGSIAAACEGIDGFMMLTAANESETSKADMYDSELGVYLSNGFTRAFQTKILEDPDVILRDLFYYVVGQTSGSHASLYNYRKYGNIYKESLREMLTSN